MQKENKRGGAGRRFDYYRPLSNPQGREGATDLEAAIRGKGKDAEGITEQGNTFSRKRKIHLRGFAVRTANKKKKSERVSQRKRGGKKGR